MLKPLAIALSLGLTGATFLSGAAAPVISATKTTIPVEKDLTAGSAVFAVKEPTKEDMQKILLAVKQKISVPTSLSDFDYRFTSANYDSVANWIFSWSNPSSDESLVVQCDDAANIMEYKHRTGNTQSYVPNYLRSELMNTADKFISTIASQLAGHFELVSNDNSTNTYTGLYYYNYQRVENKIPMPDNSIKVGVNYETGKVMSFQANWDYDLTIPSSSKTLTAQDAAKKLGTKLKMQLSYRNEYKEDGSIRAFLVYSPDQNYISVDAVTGEIYLTKPKWNFNSTDGESSKEEDAPGNMKDSGTGSLTEEEISKLSELNKLITREEAVKQVTTQKDLLLDKNSKEISASLAKRSDKNGKESYYWNISFSDPRPQDNEKDSYRASSRAVVDAKTGKLVSFRASVPSYYDTSKEEWENIKINYSKEKCNSILEAFLKKQIPDQFRKTEKAYADNSYIVKYIGETPVYGGYDCFYQRMNEGIAYPYNGIYGSVDGVTGKIYSYHASWDDNIRFESPKAAMKPETALDTYLSKEGYGLYYEVISIHTLSDTNSSDAYYDAEDKYSVEKEVRLVYLPAISPSTISPFNGSQLDYDGKVYTSEKPYTYQDITGSPYAREIKLLADLGIGFSGGSYYPDKSITITEFKHLLNSSWYSNLTEFKDSGSNITIMQALKQIITSLDLEKIAAIQSIFTTDFKNDAALISDKGYIALAQGLGILEKGNQTATFDPNRIVTRAEAAHYVLNVIKARKSYQ